MIFYLITSGLQRYCVSLAPAVCGWALSFFGPSSSCQLALPLYLVHVAMGLIF